MDCQSWFALVPFREENGVRRFPGGRNAENEAAALQQLKDWMTGEALSVLSPPVFAYFDPPWTPGFLRRNEVMLRTDSGKP